MQVSVQWCDLCYRHVAPREQICPVFSLGGIVRAKFFGRLKHAPQDSLRVQDSGRCGSSQCHPTRIAGVIVRRERRWTTGLRVHKAERLVVRRVHENRSVTGREKFYLVAVFLAHRRDKSGETFWSEVLSKGLVDVLEHRFQTI